jgi:hypothetical protein
MGLGRGCGNWRRRHRRLGRGYWRGRGLRRRGLIRHGWDIGLGGVRRFVILRDRLRWPLHTGLVGRRRRGLLCRDRRLRYRSGGGSCAVTAASGIGGGGSCAVTAASGIGGGGSCAVTAASGIGGGGSCAVTAASGIGGGGSCAVTAASGIGGSVATTSGSGGGGGGGSGAVCGSTSFEGSSGSNVVVVVGAGLGGGSGAKATSIPPWLSALEREACGSADGSAAPRRSHGRTPRRSVGA